MEGLPKHNEDLGKEEEFNKLEGEFHVLLEALSEAKEGDEEPARKLEEFLTANADKMQSLKGNA